MEEDRTIPTVRKHIVAQEALAGAGVAVCVEESSEGRIVIYALEVIEAGLRIVVVPAVTQRIEVRQVSGGGQERAVGVIRISGDLCAGSSHEGYHVALEVQQIVVGRGGLGIAADLRGQIQNVGPTALIVEEVQRVARAVFRIALPQKLTRGVDVIVPHAVHDLVGPQPVYIVIITDCVRPVACRRQLPPILPAQSIRGRFSD